MGSRLNIISRPALWKEADLGAPAVNIPASIPALLFLEERGIPWTGVGRRLSREDYQTLWKDSLLRTCRWVEDSLSGESPEAPNLILVHAYSLFLLTAQALAVEKALDAEGSPKWEAVRVESFSGSPTEDYLFYDGVFTPYYHEVAGQWAVDRGIPLEVVEGSVVEPPSRAWRGRDPRPMGRWIAGRLWRRWLAPISDLVRAVAGALLGRRRWIFYTPSMGGGLAAWGPAGTFNLEPWIGVLSRRSASNNVLAGEKSRCLSVLERGSTGRRSLDALVRRRFSRHVDSRAGAGHHYFQGLRGLLEMFHRRDWRAAYAAPGAPVDFTMSAYALEAFRRGKFPTAGVQHGGNARLCRRGGTPPVLAEYGLADFYFQWGEGRSDEHTEYGIEAPAPVFVKTGSPRSAEVKESAGAGPRLAGGRLRILYAPTVFGVHTAMGQTVPWDVYLPLLLRALSILSGVEADVTVKLLDTPEADTIDPRTYPRLTFVRRGGFVDLLGGADVLIVDSLGGSPVYEALCTEKPLMVYAAAENQSWQENFLQFLPGRAAFFSNGEDFLAGLRKLAEDPAETLADLRRRRSPLAAEAFAPPCPPDRFWDAIEQAMFQ